MNEEHDEAGGRRAGGGEEGEEKKDKVVQRKSMSRAKEGRKAGGKGKERSGGRGGG